MRRGAKDRSFGVEGSGEKSGRHDRDPGPREEIRGADGGGRNQLHRAGRRPVCLPWPQRRREDNDDQCRVHHAAAGRRDHPHQRLLRGRGRRPGQAKHRRRLPALGAGQPPDGQGELEGPGKLLPRAGRPAWSADFFPCRRRRPGGVPGSALRESLRRATQARRRCARAHPRAEDPLPGRAHHGAGSANPAESLALNLRHAEKGEDDRLPHHALHGGSGRR